MTDSSTRRPNYGIDAPGVVLTFVLIAAGALLAGAILRGLLAGSLPALGTGLFRTGAVTFIWCVGCACVMVLGSKVIKLRLREKLLDNLELRGDEHILDIGCGRGLMLNGAARRLKTGKVVGIDLWQTKDQSGNHPDRTLDNTRAEGVADRVRIITGDMRTLPFETGTFDAVVSSWAIHNIDDREGREKAIREIVRVLKPEGKLVIVDILSTAEYVPVLRECAMAQVQRSGPNFLFVIPSFVLTAQNPSPQDAEAPHQNNHGGLGAVARPQLKRGVAKNFARIIRIH